ncbi:MAG: hypothetical protein HYR72_10295 [Deltaproteobacteria bacterium]|nr:hypothetical protein [Deltaproteobacteria bacterium]MBI3388090.1 hypothetical protein [Deltaproteobacteria bacterium]
MIVLDENIPENQRQLLRSWRVRVQQIGHDLGHQGLADDAIVSLLRRLGSATFFTRDLRFCQTARCHPRYCLVCLAVEQYEAATFIRRMLRHRRLNTRRRRMGTVVRVTHTGLRVWRRSGDEEVLSW